MKRTTLRAGFITLSLALSIGAWPARATEPETPAPDTPPKVEEKKSPQPAVQPAGARPVARAQRVCPSDSSGSQVNTLEELLAGDAARFLSALEPPPGAAPRPREAQPAKAAPSPDSAE